MQATTVRAIGILLFLPVPAVLFLFTRASLGVLASILLGIGLVVTHRLYARPFALAQAPRRCLWCGGFAVDPASIEIDEPLGRTTWAVCAAHRTPLSRFLGYVASSRHWLRFGILGAIALLLLCAALGRHPLGATLFRLIVAITVLPIGWLAVSAGKEPAAIPRPPFPVHIQALIGTHWVLWLFRLIGIVWLILALIFLAGCSARRSPKLLFVGLDGADWQLIDPLIAAGKLPHFAELKRRGSWGDLTTLEPPLSPLVWSSMLTGVSPLQHRILDFTRFNPQSGAREPITSDERRVPAIWNMLAGTDRRVAVFGMWATWPAESVDGLIVSDRLYAFQNRDVQPPARAVFPASKQSWAETLLAEAKRSVGDDRLRRYIPDLDAAPQDPKLEPLRRVLIQMRWIDRMALEHLEREPWDLAIVYHQSTDTTLHLFAPYLAPTMAGIDPRDTARYGGVAARLYEEIDELLGRYMQIAAQQRATLMIASDHGFKSGADRPREIESAAAPTAGRWHRQQGIWLIDRPGLGNGKGNAMQVCSTLLQLLDLPPGKGLAPPLYSDPNAPAPIDYSAGWRPASGPQDEGGGANEKIEELTALGYVAGREPKRRDATVSSEPTRTAGSFNNEGLLLEADRKLDAAAAAFQSAIARDPQSPSGYWNLAQLEASRGGEAERIAASTLEALRRHLPEGGSAVFSVAQRLDRDGHGDLAAKLLVDAAALLPHELQFDLEAGRFLIERRRCPAARALTEAALAADPNETDPSAADLWTVDALARACLGDEAGAQRSIQRSLALNPNQPQLLRR